jgi:hypothetical protein
MDGAWHRSLRRGPGTARRRILERGMEAALASSPDVFLRFRLPAALADDLLAAVEAARSALTALVERVPWDEPWPEAASLPSVVAARTFSVRARRVPAWVGLLALIEEFALAWDPPRAGRALDPVLVRDGLRCMAPGCTSRRNLHVHHVIYRSRGGRDGRVNLVCLCALCRYRHKPHHADCRIMPRSLRTAPGWCGWGGGGVLVKSA